MDLKIATAEEMSELDEKLAATGAGSFHMRQIRDAVARLRSESGAAAPATTAGVAMAADTSGALVPPPWQTQRRYAAFISHHQKESAMEARYLKEQLEGLLGGSQIFLDYDNLQEALDDRPLPS